MIPDLLFHPFVTEFKENHKFVYVPGGKIVPETIKLFHDKQENELVDNDKEKDDSSYFVELKDEKLPEYYSKNINVFFIDKKVEECATDEKIDT